MPTSYTPLIGLALPVTGDLSGTWGDTVNNYISAYIDAAVAGTQTITTDTTLTKTTGAALDSTSSQYMVLRCSPSSANITVTAPAASKTYVVINTSGTYTVTIRGAGPTTGVTLAVNEKAIVAWNGSDFVKVASTSASTINAGTLAVANGGTGQTTYTDGQLLIGNSTGNTLTKATLTQGTGVTITNSAGGITISATGSGGTVTSVTGSGNIASSGGATPNITFTGTLPTANGGTGLTSFTANGVVYASSSSALATGSVLTFDGSQLTINGINAGRGASSVSTNTVFGASALTTANSFSLNNTAIGYGTINTITNAIGNTALGSNALNLTTGNYNTCIGYNTGKDITTGGSNTIIGRFAGASGDFDIRTRNSFVVLANGDADIRAVYNADGVPFYVQPTPTSKSTTATLTGAEVLTQILNTTGSSYSVTMPTGTALETAIGSLPTNMAFDFTVVNTASGTITMVVNTGITAVGSLSVPTGTSATYKIRKTASNTFVMYRS